MDTTSIQWTDFSSNPLRYLTPEGKTVWACEKTSPACAHCYAETLAFRYGRGSSFVPKVTSTLSPYIDEKEMTKLVRSPKLAGKRLFLCDMTDWLGDWVDTFMVDDLVAFAALRPDVTVQLLTKRSRRLRAYFNDPAAPQRVADAIGFAKSPWMFSVDQLVRNQTANRLLGRDPAGREIVGRVWPPPNLWLGVSIENQAMFDLRIDDLKGVDASVRFISFEPLLGEIEPVVDTEVGPLNCLAPFGTPGTDSYSREIEWAIIGGESGGNSRPFYLPYARKLIKRCRAAGTRVFVKQLGARPQNAMIYGSAVGNEDRAIVREPFKLKHRQGGDMAEWPEDLQFREFPEVA